MQLPEEGRCSVPTIPASLDFGILGSTDSGTNDTGIVPAAIFRMCFRDIHHEPGLLHPIHDLCTRWSVKARPVARVFQGRGL